MRNAGKRERNEDKNALVNRVVERASWYLGHGLHHRLWERATVAYTGHATIADNLKAVRRDKKSLYKVVNYFSQSFTLTSANCGM